MFTFLISSETKFAINEFDKELQYESKKWEHNFDSL